MRTLPRVSGSTAPRRASVGRLSLLGVVLTAVIVAGCTSGDPEPEPESGFDVYREFIDALRQSPDHLPAQADRLVAEGDPVRIFEFVRDQIQTYPPQEDGMGSNDFIEVQYFGSRGTLRGGAGTPRDKVELLRELYERAGFEATLVSGRVVDEYRDLKTWLPRAVTRDFDPAVDDERLDRWISLLDIDIDAPLPPPIDEGRVESEALAETLWPLVREGGELTSADFDWRWRERLPLVAVTIEGEVRYASPLIPDAVFGESYTTAVEPITEEASIPAVRVLLEGVSSLAPDERFTLVEGEWSAADLAGRQLTVSMVPGLATADLLQTQLHQVPLFVPVLAIQALDVPSDSEESLALSALTFVGPGISPAGNRIELLDDGRVLVDDIMVHDPSINPGNTASVTGITGLTVDPGRFAAVTVRFTPQTSAGLPVEELRASDMELTEDGVRMPFLLAANRQAPRLYVMIDQSLSMPAEWRTTEVQEAFVSHLEAAVRSVHPRAHIILDPRGDSDLWSNMARAAHQNPTAIVYVTDGDVADSPTDEIETVLRSGPPAVLLYVGNRAQPVLESMAELTKGAVLEVSDQGAAPAAILDFLNTQEIAAYTLTYRAPVGGLPIRTVTVRIPSTDVEETVVYEVPVTPETADLIGLYLTVESAGTTVTRTLAGRHHLALASHPLPTNPAQDVASVLWSEVSIAFEGAKPPISVLLEDLLRAKLSLEPLHQALIADDSSAIVDALAAGLHRFEGDVAMLQPPLWESATDQRFSFETGLRATLVVEGPVFGTNFVRRRLDVLPLGQPSTAIEGTENARHAATFQETARLAIAESTFHTLSTASLLAGQPLAYLGRSNVNHFSDHPELSEEVQARWRQVLQEYSGYPKIVPASGDPIAFWAVDRETGALLGVLENGSGGAESYVEILRMVEEVISVADYLNSLAEENHPYGLSEAAGAAAATGQILARLFGVGTLVVASLDGYDIPDLMKRDILATACEALQKIAPSGNYEGADHALTALILGNQRSNNIWGRTGCIGSGG